MKTKISQGRIKGTFDHRPPYEQDKVIGDWRPSVFERAIDSWRAKKWWDRVDKLGVIDTRR